MELVYYPWALSPVLVAAVRRPDAARNTGMVITHVAGAMMNGLRGDSISLGRTATGPFRVPSDVAGPGSSGTARRRDTLRPSGAIAWRSACADRHAAAIAARPVTWLVAPTAPVCPTRLSNLLSLSNFLTVSPCSNRQTLNFSTTPFCAAASICLSSFDSLLLILLLICLLLLVPSASIHPLFRNLPAFGHCNLAILTCCVHALSARGREPP